jgi:hypothetical protein
MPRSAAIRAVNAVASPACPRNTVSCKDAAGFFLAYNHLLDAVERLCQSESSDPPSPHTPPADSHSGTALAQQPAADITQSKAAPASEGAKAGGSSGAGPSAELRSVFALDQALLLDEPELTLLVLTRMLSIVSLGAHALPSGKRTAADAAPASTGPSDAPAAEPPARAGQSVQDRVAGMVQVAADGLHVAMHCVLACEPAALPQTPSFDSLPQIADWVKRVRDVVGSLSDSGAAQGADADSAHEHTPTQPTVVSADGTPVQPAAAANLSPLSNATGADVTPTQPVVSSCNLDARLRDAHPKLHEVLAFLEGQRALKGDAGGLWFGMVYARLRESLSEMRAEGATVFQNLVAACGDAGVPVLHEAVLDANIDAAELLLMLGASPLQRAALDDGTEVHWQHGVDTGSNMPAPTLVSNSKVQKRLGGFCCRPAAWQPVLKSVTGSAQPAGADAPETYPEPPKVEGKLESGTAHLSALAVDAQWPGWVREGAADIATSHKKRRASAICCYSTAAGDIYPTAAEAEAPEVNDFSEVSRNAVASSEPCSVVQSNAFAASTANVAAMSCLRHVHLCQLAAAR